jgi:hypothetical protein
VGQNVTNKSGYQKEQNHQTLFKSSLNALVILKIFQAHPTHLFLLINLRERLYEVEISIQNSTAQIVKSGDKA